MEPSKVSSVILAGGKGERLYPITQTRPKPLCPVGDTSCLVRCINAAKAAGIEDITVAACYLADKIVDEVRQFKNIKVKIETTMLGTAGCVKECNPSGDDILILSGDGVNDFDLKALLDFHKKSGCICTVAITRSPFPTEYGVVNARDGIVRRFCEKPMWEKVTSDTVNTGIYVLTKEALSFIPENTVFDFSNNLFPLIMEKGYKIAAWDGVGFWCDIGNPKALYDCSMRYTGNKSSIHPSAVIDNDASVNAAIIMENTVVGKNSVVDTSIICENVVIGNNVLVPRGCVVGAGCRIGDNAILAEGITIAAGTIIGKGGRIVKDIKFGGVKGRLFDGDEGINGVYGKTFDISDALSLGRALCEVAGENPKIGVMFTGSPANLLAKAVECGVRYAGGMLYWLGEGFESLCAFSAKEYVLSFSVFIKVDGDNSLNIMVFDSNADPVRGKTLKSIENSFYRGGKGEDADKGVYYPEEFESPLYLYTASLALRCDGLEGFSLSVDESNIPGKVLASVIKREGANVSDDNSLTPRISVSADGRGLDIATESRKTLDFWRTLAFYLGFVAESKKAIYIPEDTPDGVVEYVASKGGECIRCGDSQNAGKDFDFCYKDALFLVLSVLDICRKKGISLDEVSALVPSFHIRLMTGEYDEEGKASKIKRLCDECGRDDGAKFIFEKGYVRFVPSSHKGFKIIAEAASSEYAKELCDFALDKLKD